MVFRLEETPKRAGSRGGKGAEPRRSPTMLSVKLSWLQTEPTALRAQQE